MPTMYINKVKTEVTYPEALDLIREKYEDGSYIVSVLPQIGILLDIIDAQQEEINNWKESV